MNKEIKSRQVCIKARITCTESSTADLLGRKYSVLPAVMMKVGAYSPNVSDNYVQGEMIYFSGDELKSSVNSWNGRPVSLNHPESSISCNTPENYTKQWMGYVFNAAYDETSESLRSDIWIDSERGKFIVDKVSEGDNIDLSIGAFGEIVEEKGNINNVAYNYRFTSIVGDHLAVLPETRGACSWEDGCGIRADSSADFASDDPELPRKERRNSMWGGICCSYAEKNRETSQKNEKLDRSETDEEIVSEGALRSVISSRGAQAEVSKEARESAITISKGILKKEFSMDKTNASENVEVSASDVKSCAQSNEPAVKENAITPSVTMESFLADAPQEIKATLIDAVNARNAQRDEYVKIIGSCKYDDVKFCSMELAKTSTNMLRSLSGLVTKVNTEPETSVKPKAVKAANYVMQGSAEHKSVGYMAPTKIDWNN